MPGGRDMDAALNSVLGPWAQLGITGSVVVALALANIFQWRRQEALHRAIDALQESRLSDRDKQLDRIVALLTSGLQTSNRVADGMEAMERIFAKVKS
jgi:hypothetical protein